MSFYEDEYDPYDYDPQEGPDPSECLHDQGNVSMHNDVRDSRVECDDCGTEGVRFFIMGEQREAFPFTYAGDDTGGEDRAMESYLFGDC